MMAERWFKHSRRFPGTSIASSSHRDLALASPVICVSEASAADKVLRDRAIDCSRISCRNLLDLDFRRDRNHASGRNNHALIEYMRLKCGSTR